MSGAEIVGDLIERIGLRVSPTSMSAVMNAAAPLTWTRDPFDRLLVADALVASAPFLTKDAHIADHCRLAIW